MPVDTVWVVAEITESGPSSITQELLSKARSIATNVAAIAWGPDTASHAAALGEYGATKVYDVGDVGETLPGVPVAGAIAALIEGGDTPDALLVPASYDGRDVAGRLSAKLDRPVLTNVVGLSENGGLSSEHTLFGGTVAATAHFTGEGPQIFVVRAKSFTAEPGGGGAAEVVSAPAPAAVRPGRPRSPRATSRSAPARSSTRPP